MAATCARHPNQRAAYRCKGCGRHLCTACVTERDIGTNVIKICVLCSGSTEPLHAEDASVGYIASQVLVAPFRKHGLITLGIAALVFTFAPFVPFGGLIAAGAAAAFFFLTVNTASKGEFDVPEIGDISDWIDDLLLPAIKFTLAGWTVWLPVVLYFVFFKAGDIAEAATSAEAVRELLDPVLLALLLLGVVYMPMATLVAAMQHSILALLNPFLVFGLIFRAPGAYFAALLMFYAAMAVGGVFGLIVGLVFGLLGIPIVPSLLGWFVQLYAYFVCASVLGGLAFLRGESYGLAPVRRPGSSVDISHLPQVAGGSAPAPTTAAPPATPTPAAPADPFPAAPMPAASPPQPPMPAAPQPPMPAAPSTQAPLELPPEPAAELSAPETGIPILNAEPEAPSAAAASADPAALVAAGDVDGACEAYLLQLQTNARAVLPPDVLMAVAQRLQAREQYAEAVAAYRKLGALYGDHPQAANALLQAAFVAFRQLGQREDAVLILEFLASRYPGSPAEAQARQILVALKPQG